MSSHPHKQKGAVLDLIDEVAHAQKEKEKSSLQFSTKRLQVLQERQQRREKRKQAREAAAEAAMNEAREKLREKRLAARRERRETFQREVKRARRELEGKPSVHFA